MAIGISLRATRHAIQGSLPIWQRGKLTISPLNPSNSRTVYTNNYVRLQKIFLAGKLKVSKGEDYDTILEQLEELVGSGWALHRGGVGIYKVFQFNNWMKHVRFVARIGIESKTANHHPAIILKYGSVTVHWTTHKPHGLSSKDIDMAICCDRLADLTRDSNASIGFNESPPSNKSTNEPDGSS